MSTRSTGALAERLSALFLEINGYSILARATDSTARKSISWRPRTGPSRSSRSSFEAATEGGLPREAVDRPEEAPHHLRRSGVRSGAQAREHAAAIRRHRSVARARRTRASGGASGRGVLGRPVRGAVPPGGVQGKRGG